MDCATRLARVDGLGDGLRWIFPIPCALLRNFDALTSEMSLFQGSFGMAGIWSSVLIQRLTCNLTGLGLSMSPCFSYVWHDVNTLSF